MLCLYFAVFDVSAQPIFKFSTYKQGEEKKFISKLKEFHIEPTIEQQKDVLMSLIKISEYSSIVFNFLIKFDNALDEHFKTAFSKKWPEEKDRLENLKEPFLPEVDKIFLSLDFDKDGYVDLFLMPAVYFGPSIGYACYGYQNGKIQHFFDKGGFVVNFEKRENLLVFQYEVIKIEATEPLVLETIVFDLTLKKLRYDSKLYYAEEGEIPELGKLKEFELKKPSVLRTSPKVDDSPQVEAPSYELDKTRTLRGNVIAEYPLASKGILLAKKGKYAFVAFYPESVFLGSSLEHGMENVKSFESYEPIIKPYHCGWILKKDIKLKR